MAVNPGSLITAANYNSLQARVANMLGNGFEESGYGQSLVSAPVNAGSESVLAEHMELLRTDINRLHVHQTGSLSALGEISIGETVGANNTTGDVNKGFNQYLSVVTILEANVQIVDGTQVTLETATTSTRFASWNGKIIHSFTVTFNNDTHRRAFFNAGGEIQMSGQIEGDATAKGQDWNTILTNMGTIKFKANTTEKTGSAGLLQPVGNFDLTASYQKIFERRGQADYYAENRYFIYAKETSNRSIQFSIEFEDNDQGDPNDDELVRGTITSVIKQLRPTGSYVSIASPSYSTQSNLSTGD
tara:strand:- start:13279 stop:14187 length:909 start_codon:yes stop_codon:yes gene_type:complete